MSQYRFSFNNNYTSYSYYTSCLCLGIEIAWIKKPPSHVGLNEVFNVSYRLIVKKDSFFTSMVAFDFEEYRNANIRYSIETREAMHLKMFFPI